MKNSFLIACLGGGFFLFGLEEITKASGSDNFLSATVITNLNSPIIGSNVNATGEPGEPNHAGVSGSMENGRSGNLNSVWWKWVAPANGLMTINTVWINFDTTLAIYTGTSVASLSEVVSNDDIINGIDRASKVSFYVVSGTVYWIAVDGWLNEVGDISLNLSFQPYPVSVNDNFANATSVTRKTPFLVDHNIGATSEPNEPNHAGVASPLNSIWYQWAADTSGSVTISTLGSDFNTTLSVYTGTNLSSLSLVASNDDYWGSQSQVTFTASTATIYRIAVDGYSNSVGNVSLGFAFPDLLPTNAPLGATINKNGTNITGVTFRVWAPNATSVSVRGQFNGWGETFMTNDVNTDYWTVTDSAARPNQEYRYFLKWNGNTNGSWKNDPRAVWIRNNNCVIYDQTTFDWGSVTNPVIPTDQQVMYELHVGTFNDPDPRDGHPGTFYDAIKRLDYLKNLGINVIVLMPIHEFGGDFSWGYNPGDVYAIESAYGGPEALKSFVKEAHARGMAVHVDVVHNHYNSSSEGLWEFDGPGNIYFYSDGRASTDWGPRPDFDKPEVRRFLQDHTRMLLEKFRVDGFRWDSPENILGYQTMGTNRVLAAGKMLMTQIHRMINTEFPNVRSVAENSNLLIIRTPPTTDPLGVFEASDSFHGHWNYGFFYSVIEQITSAQPNFVSISNNLLLGPERPGYRVLFSDNHDKAGGQHNTEKGVPVVRLASRIDSNNPTSWLARKKGILGGLLPLTVPGVPMLFMGQEFQASGIFSDTNPLSWVQAGQQYGIFRAYRDLLNLRANLNALQNTNAGPTDATFDSANGICSYPRRGSGASGDVFVILNLSGEAKTNLSLSFPSSGNWYVRLNSDWKIYGADFGNVGPLSNRVSVNANLSGSITIAPWSGLIFSQTSASLSLPLEDADGDGMPDGWEDMYGVTDPNADPDGDGIINLAEYRRLSSPLVVDRMSVVGSQNPLSWAPDDASLRMSWSDTRQRWEWRGAFGAGSVQFKFASGPGWTGSNYGTGSGIAVNTAFSSGPDNLSINLTSGRYRFAFSETNGAYSVESFPVSSEWRETNGLSLMGAWTNDTDQDGVNDLLEYALGGNPNLMADGKSLQSLSLTQATGTNRLRLEWLERNDGGSTLSVTPELATNFGGPWSSLPSSLAANQTEMPANHQRREVTTPIDSTNRKFLRLKVTGP